MAIRFPKIVNAKQALRRAFMASEAATVPKGHFAVYIGEFEKKICGSHFTLEASFISEFAKSG